MTTPSHNPIVKIRAGGIIYDHQLKAVYKWIAGRLWGHGMVVQHSLGLGIPQLLFKFIHFWNDAMDRVVVKTCLDTPHADDHLMTMLPIPAICQIIRLYSWIEEDWIQQISMSTKAQEFIRHEMELIIDDATASLATTTEVQTQNLRVLVIGHRAELRFYMHNIPNVPSIRFRAKSRVTYDQSRSCTLFMTTSEIMDLKHQQYVSAQHWDTVIMLQEYDDSDTGRSTKNFEKLLQHLSSIPAIYRYQLCSVPWNRQYTTLTVYNDSICYRTNKRVQQQQRQQQRSDDWLQRRFMHIDLL